eukprot:COSAG06_NODE_25747_length_629_cov_1.156604_1_plen_189_part_01
MPAVRIAPALVLDVFSGRVVLRGLQVNQDAFTALGLPVHLVASYVGEIELDIPFANLKTEPILVTVRQVYISLSPDVDCDKRTMEQLQLEAHEAKWNDLKPVGDQQAEEEDEEHDFLSGYMQKIMDNIQITIEDVHIRYEDGLTAQRSSWASDAASVFTAGVTLDRVEMKSFQVSEQGEWEERFVAEGQ